MNGPNVEKHTHKSTHICKPVHTHTHTLLIGNKVKASTAERDCVVTVLTSHFNWMTFQRQSCPCQEVPFFYLETDPKPVSFSV